MVTKLFHSVFIKNKDVIVKQRTESGLAFYPVLSEEEI